MDNDKKETQEIANPSLRKPEVPPEKEKEVDADPYFYLKEELNKEKTQHENDVSNLRHMMLLFFVIGIILGAITIGVILR